MKVELPTNPRHAIYVERIKTIEYFHKRIDSLAESIRVASGARAESVLRQIDYLRLREIDYLRLREIDYLKGRAFELQMQEGGPMFRGFDEEMGNVPYWWRQV